MAFAGNRGIDVDLPFHGVGGQCKVWVSNSVLTEKSCNQHHPVSFSSLSDGGFVLGGVGSGVGGVWVWCGKCVSAVHTRWAELLHDRHHLWLRSRLYGELFSFQNLSALTSLLRFFGICSSVLGFESHASIFQTIFRWIFVFVPKCIYLVKSAMCCLQQLWSAEWEGIHAVGYYIGNRQLKVDCIQSSRLLTGNWVREVLDVPLLNCVWYRSCFSVTIDHSVFISNPISQTSNLKVDSFDMQTCSLDVSWLSQYGVRIEIMY